MKQILILLALLLLISMSCTKDDNAVLTDPVDQENPIVIEDPEESEPPEEGENPGEVEDPVEEEKRYIIIGDTAGVRIDKAVKVVSGGYYFVEELYLDLNGDGSSEIRFQVGYGSSPGQGEYQIANMSRLHSRIALLNVMEIDSVFLRMLVSYQQTNQGIVKHTDLWYNCRKLNHHFKLHSAEEKGFISVRNNADTIGFNEVFLKKSLGFNYSHTNTTYHQLNDTTYISEAKWDYNCRIVPTRVPVFMGFRLEKDGYYFYGWIKLYFFSYTHIRVDEVAIMREGVMIDEE